ncbi:MAG: hypothetical protein J6O56_02885 [Bacilli bacterium]|nr:hypothetical protein [Bacilli bacterium]
MIKIDNLKELKKRLMLLGSLTVLSTSILSNKIDSMALETEKSIIDEDDITVNNANNNCEEDIEKIEYYSNVFGIKKEAIYDRLDYLSNETVDNENFLNMNIDLKVITACREIYYDNEYSEDLTRTGKTYEVTLTPEEMIEKYSEIYGINKEVALSIVYCECGSDVDSYNYRVNNNPAGLGPDMYFENKEIGIIYFINLLKNSYGCEKDSGTEFLRSIASTYCEIPDHWLSLTLPFYNSLCEDYYYMKPELKKKENIYLKSYGYKNEKESN